MKRVLSEKPRWNARFFVFHKRYSQEVSNLAPQIDARDQKDVDLSIKFYESARAELIQRIVLRDSALVFYIGAVGAYFQHIVGTGIISHGATKASLLQALLFTIPLPFVCVTFSLIILQHHITVGRIGAYLRSEILFGKLGSGPSTHWDNSKAFLDHANFLIELRLYAQGIILCLPLIYSLALFVRYFSTAKSLGWMWISLLVGDLVFSILITALIAGLHIYAHAKRRADW